MLMQRAPSVAYLRAKYDAGVARIDNALGRLFRELERRGLYDDALIVVTSDHGESFFEHRVFVGHLYLTLELGEKLEMLKRFFQPETSDSARERFMRSHRIRYLIHSPLEMRVGGYRPENSRFLRPVFRRGPIRIYELRR